MYVLFPIVTRLKSGILIGSLTLDLRQTFAGRIDRMGRVANPETLERAPRYEYNPRNIFGATQL